MKPLPPPACIDLKASPLTGEIHEWRLIDFEYAVQTNFITAIFRQFYWPNCAHLFDEIQSSVDPDQEADDEEWEEEERDSEGNRKEAGS